MFTVALFMLVNALNCKQMLLGWGLNKQTEYSHNGKLPEKRNELLIHAT